MVNSERKKVCVFTIHPARDLRILNRQCESLQKHGLDVTLIAISDEGTFTYNNIKVIGVKKWKSNFERIKVLFQITRMAYRQKADIYHFHDPDFLVHAVLIKLLSGKPVIYDIHEFYHINKPRRLPDIWPLRQILSLFIWLMETLCGTIIGNISAVYLEHVRRFSKVGCRTVHTPNYASIEDFVPIPVTQEEWDARRKTVLFTGTLDPEKGSLVMLDIAKELKQVRPDIKILVTRRFLAKFQEETMLQKMALPGYQDVIEFIPNVSGKELPKVVRKAGVGLSPIQNVVKIMLQYPPNFSSICRRLFQ